MTYKVCAAIRKMKSSKKKNRPARAHGDYGINNITALPVEIYTICQTPPDISSSIFVAVLKRPMTTV